MEQALSIKEELLSSLQQMLHKVVEAAPTVIAGIVLVIVALIVAKIVEKLLRVILRRVKLDALLERTGVKAALARIGLGRPIDEFLPRLVYFLLLFLFAQTAANALGLAPISQAIGSFFAYLPNLVAALLLILIGSVAGQFAGGAVSRSARNAGIEYGSALGSLVSAFVLAIAGIMAVGQLKIDTEIVRIVTTCLLAGLGLAFGLSFGLGSREITRNIIVGFYARKVFRIGETVEIGGERAVLKAITPVQVLLDKEGQTIAISNGAFLDQVVRQ